MNRIIKLATMLLVAMVLASPLLLASDSLPFAWFSANGQPGVQLDTTGNIKQYVVGASITTAGGRIAGTGAASYTVTFNVSQSDANYKVFTQLEGATSNTTTCSLFISAPTTTGFVITPSAASALSVAGAANIDFFLMRGVTP